MIRLKRMSCMYLSMLNDCVDDQAEVDALRRQLMRVMRDAASRPDDLKPVVGSQRYGALV
jgi:hypothetical protein